jgi:hypothetical protein
VLPGLARRPDDPARISRGEDVRRDVAGDDAARPDRRAVPDGDSGTDDGAAPDPHVVTDRDGFRRFGSLDALLSVERMGRALVAPARPGDLNC